MIRLARFGRFPTGSREGVQAGPGNEVRVGDTAIRVNMAARGGKAAKSSGHVGLLDGTPGAMESQERRKLTLRCWQPYIGNAN